MLIWIRNKWRKWRLRPGLILAAQCAQDAAWSHPNTYALGPELNLQKLSNVLRRMA